MNDIAKINNQNSNFCNGKSVINKEWKFPIVFGHRGASGYVKENTLEAFRKAVEMGADGIETDCWMLADGNIVCHHDKAVHVEGQDPINISKMTLEEIKSIKLDGKFEIPTIDEVFKEFSEKKAKSGNPLLFSIDMQDLKVGAGLVSKIKEYNLEKRVFLCGETTLKLKRVRKADPNKEILLVASNIQDQITPENLDESSKISKIDVCAFNIQAELFKKEQIDILRQFGLLCFIWDLHGEEDLRKYIKFLPDAVYSNYPDVAIKVRNES